MSYEGGKQQRRLIQVLKSCAPVQSCWLEADRCGGVLVSFACDCMQSEGSANRYFVVYSHSTHALKGSQGST